MNINTLNIPYEELAAYCRENQIEYLAIFGSAVRDELRADSDVDLLVEFDAAAKIGFMALARMQRELGALFRRPVDLVPRSGLKPIIPRGRSAQRQDSLCGLIACS